MVVKVLIENSVLIAASLNCFYEKTGFKLVDGHHKISMPLFNFFAQNIGKYGISTHTIEKNVEAKLISIIEKRVNAFSKGNEKTFYDTLSRVRTEIIRNFELNKKLLIRQPIDDREVDKNLNDITLFYQDIKKTIFSQRPDRYQISGFKGAFRRRLRRIMQDATYYERKKYDKLIKKFTDDQPDLGDYEILAQAIYIKKKVLSDNDKLFLASTDHHFSKIRGKEYSPEDETLVPDMIENKFKILCKWPNEILKELSEY